MTTAANTRIFKGSYLKVDDLASGWIEAHNIISMPQSFGASKAKLDIATAADDYKAVDLGIANYSDATFDFFLDMDDPFQAEMWEMYNATDITSQIRTFKLVTPEGTNNVLTFTAFVVQQPTTYPLNNYVKMTLTLCVQSRPTWGAS